MVWWDWGGEIEKRHPPPFPQLCDRFFFEKWGGCQARSKKCAVFFFVEKCKRKLALSHSPRYSFPVSNTTTAFFKPLIDTTPAARLAARVAALQELQKEAAWYSKNSPEDKEASAEAFLAIATKIEEIQDMLSDLICQAEGLATLMGELEDNLHDGESDNFDMSDVDVMVKEACDI